MAIATEQIVTTYTADASGHMRAVAQIVTAQREVTKSIEDSAVAQSKAGNSATEFLSKWNLGLGGARGAINLLRSSTDSLIQDQRLAASSSSVNIDALAESSGGLVSRLDLMTLAAAGSTSAFKANQQQLNDAAGAIRTLTREGKDQEAVTQAVTEALSKGSGEELKKFGISVEGSTTKIGGFNNLMRELAAVSVRATGAHEIHGEGLAKLQVSFEDTMRNIRVSIGEMVLALQPLIEAGLSVADTFGGWIGTIGKFGGLIGRIVSNTELNDFNPFSSNTDEQRMRFSRGLGKMDDEQERRKGTGLSHGDYMKMRWREMQDTAQQSINNEQITAGIMGSLDNLGAVVNRFATLAATGVGALNRSTSRGGRGASPRPGLLRGNLGEDLGESLAKSFKDQQEEQDRISKIREEMAQTAVKDFIDGNKASFEAVHDQFAKAKAILDEAGTRDSRHAAFDAGAVDRENANNPGLAKIFGPLSDFDLYGKAFEGLTGAVSGAMSAWIDGTGEAGAAFRHFVADTMKSLSIEMAVMAIREAAWGFATLYSSPVAAGQHFIAAGKFAIGAAAAGVAANLLGTSASGGGAGSSGSARAPNTAPTGAAPTGAIVVIGDSFAEDSPRARYRKSEKLIARAIGGKQGAGAN